MARLSETTVEQEGRRLVLSRIFDAPQELVFSMFSNPEHLAKWWGPTDWPATIVTFDFKPGGSWHYYMTGPDGVRSWGKSIFEVIDEPNSVSFTDAFSNEAGDVDPEQPKGLITMTFKDVDGKTLLTSVSEYGSAEEVERLVKMGMIEGVKDTWNQLERLLAGQDS